VLAGAALVPQGQTLVVAGALSAVAAMLHLAVIAGGASWYRFFGAGEGMARLAERGALRPTLITLAIAGVLAIWAAYAFSGAGLIPRLPLLRLGLVTIAAIYLLRGSVIIWMLIARPRAVTRFWIWSSAIVLVYGAAYAIGAWLVWPVLSAPGRL
jgi:hypothetical protein